MWGRMKQFWLAGILCTMGLATAGTAREDVKTLEVATVKDAFSSGGRRIRVDSYIPRGADRHPAVLVLYGSGGSVAGKGELEDFARALAGQGTAVFLVHYFNRTGTLFVVSDDKIARLAPVWTDAVRDGVAFASAHPRVRNGSIGLFGYSLGAYLAIAESSRNPRVGVVVEVAGGIFDRLRGKITRLPPLLILHGRLDERVPVRNALEMEQTARRLGGRPQMHIYEREGHRLSEVALADATQRSLEFFRRHLVR